VKSANNPFLEIRPMTFSGNQHPSEYERADLLGSLALSRAES
jgi:hypothetical protein